MIRLKIKSFPPIKKECEIDLGKDLIIFVGPNNSGKTYVSQLIWSIFYKPKETDFLNYLLHSSYIKQIEKLVKKDSNIPFLRINEEVIKLFEKVLGEYLHQELPDIYGDRIPHEAIKFELEIDPHEFLKRIRYLRYDSDYKNRFLPFLGSVKKRRNSYKVNFLVDPNKLKSRFQVLLAITLRDILIKPLIGVDKTFYLPAFRTSIPIVISKLIKAQSESIVEGKIHERKTYTEPVEKLIFDTLLEISEFKKHKMKIIPPESVLNMKNTKLLSKLVEILKGQIQVEVSEEVVPIPSFSYRSADIELPMTLSSSMVNQLSLFYVLFESYLLGKLFFIIDEPEIHLHPETKVRFAEFLIDFVKNGNKLLLTTHSTLFVRVLENYLLFGKLKEALPEEELEELIGYLELDPRLSLEPRSVGAYFFSGEEIIPYEDRGFGLLLSDFAKNQEKVFLDSRILREEIFKLASRRNGESQKK
ncbi:AAA family ATPase [Desulfurobacterium crinifex]